MPDSSERPPDWPATEQSPWARPLMRGLMRLLARSDVQGAENVPAPPVLITTNHLSYFDIPALAPSLPPGVIGMAAEKYRGTWMEPIFRVNALIWVRQFSADRDALRKALVVLEHGAAVAIAPEGTRSKTGGLIEGRDGAAFLATRANVPILPAVVWGTEKVLRRPRPLVHVRIGRPYRLPEGRAKGPQLSEYTERIMGAIAAMMPESYHGVYPGNPLIEEMAAVVS
mgnify:FL=1